MTLTFLSHPCALLSHPLAALTAVHIFYQRSGSKLLVPDTFLQ